MQSKASTPEQYMEQLPEERKKALETLRKTIRENLPGGFEETMSYGMIGYVIPHSVYPDGYHAKPELPLPFINIASQKNYLALYHMGLYSDKKLLDWFKNAWSSKTKSKLDIGKSCVRFKDAEDIPYDLIAELATKITADEWIKRYEANRKKK
ncbi:MAG TPA: DUF1801 domain-containing protein [Bacteroidales bacterium]|jgi:uncharacterized protein YdhG (YjbR/CyaY superfamily)|nr:DUF1801 domain-containing protein [Bacteroidales bacterium]